MFQTPKVFTTFFLLSCLLWCSKALGQERYKIFFEYGKHRLRTTQVDSFRAWLGKYDLTTVDSIQFVGFADLGGKGKNNLKLSEKRATTVQEIFIKKNGAQIPSRVLPRGEKNKQIESLDRRVEVRLYLQPKEIKTVKDTMPFVDTVKRCYLVDYYLMQCCHITEVTYKKAQYIQLEISFEDLLSRKKIKHYSRSADDTVKVILQKLKWMPKNTGSLWWEKQRYQALIPKKDFDKYKVFVVAGGLPCDSCFKDPVINAIRGIGKCMAQDIFLNRNLQYKMRFFNRKNVRVRVPKEYVDLTDAYYRDGNKKDPIQWKTNKRNNSYYYTTLKLHKRFDTRIYHPYGLRRAQKGRGIRYFHPVFREMDCCWLKAYRGEGISTSFCGGVHGGSPILGLFLGAEAGDNYLVKHHVPYAGITFTSYGNQAVGRLLLGVDKDVEFNASFRYQYHFWYFDPTMFNPFNKWQQGSMGTVEVFPVMGTHIGAEIRGNRFGGNDMFLEENIHLGARYFFKRPNVSLFAHYGMARNHNAIYKKGFYGLLQFGIEYNLRLL